MKAKIILLSIIFSFAIISYSQTDSNKENPSQKIQEAQKAPEQMIKLIGNVTDSVTQKPIQMGFVTIVGTNIGTLTDQDGNFIIQAPVGAKQIAVGAKGYKPLKAVIDSKKEMKVKLVPKDK